MDGSSSRPRGIEGGLIKTMETGKLSQRLQKVSRFVYLFNNFNNKTNKGNYDNKEKYNCYKMG